MFEAILQIIEARAEVVSDERVDLCFTLGLSIPVGPGQVMPLPGGRVRIPMGKEAALDFLQRVQTDVETMPDPKPESDLVVASNMAGVDQAMKAAAKFRGQ